MTSRGNENKSQLNNANVKAFLDLIARSEGTYNIGNNGYNLFFGFGQFTDYSKHPNIVHSGGGYSSTAAGRYQFLYKTWKGVAASNGLPDFTPASQDIGAVELLRQRGALNYILNGDIETAIKKAAKEWASFPGAGYGQPTRTMSTLLNWFAGDVEQYGGKKKVVSTGTANQGTQSAGLFTAGIPPIGIILLIGAAIGLIYYNYK